ncbi:MAG: FAD-binding oxidoreductase [Candidatus Babeliaceae bacterium]|nr:FAD-binding oxidoreductase [Candidatus Babeliaceae bacterium]
MKNHSQIKFLLSLLLAATCVIYAEQIEIRSIKPPKLDAAHLGKEIRCYRPMRRGSPDMTVRRVANRVVATNAGHGGSGWTLGPGCAAYVNSLLINSPYAQDLTLDTPITVIGAGALGLFSAYDLVQRGYTNITIVAEKMDDLTSHNAGGLLAPVSMDNDPEMQKIIDEIGIEAYNFYAKIAHNSIAYFDGGAVIVPTYFRDRNDSGLEPYVGVVMEPAKDVILDFGNGTTQKMVVYDDGIFIDTAKMMRALHAYLSSKVTFISQKITDFEQIADTYIINCTGLGSKELNNDSEFISVQGHLIMLKDQNPSDLNYMILVYFGESINQNGQHIKRSFYMFPKHLPNSGVTDVGVVGGTFIEGATEDTPNNEEFGILIKGAQEFYGIQL